MYIKNRKKRGFGKKRNTTVQLVKKYIYIYIYIYILHTDFSQHWIISSVSLVYLLSVLNVALFCGFCNTYLIRGNIYSDVKFFCCAVAHVFSIWIKYRSCHLDVSKRKDVLIYFTKLTGKQYRRIFIFNNVNFVKFLRTTFLKNNAAL